jgi:dihydrodipicolinate synthase/N-acetylneuraminate lyase
MPLSKRGFVQFWREVSEFNPEMPLVHYNTPRARHDYTPEEYRQILDVAPNMVGTKFARTDIDLLAGLIRDVPELAHFVNEYIFPFGMMLGARGSYSFLADMNPQYALEWYQMCLDGRWGEAVSRLKRVLDWRARIMKPLYTERYFHAPNDKTKAATSDFLPPSLSTRAPYYMPDPEMIQTIRKRTRAEFPEFVL